MAFQIVIVIYYHLPFYGTGIYAILYGVQANLKFAVTYISLSWREKIGIANRIANGSLHQMNLIFGEIAIKINIRNVTSLFELQTLPI